MITIHTTREICTNYVCVSVNTASRSVRIPCTTVSSSVGSGLSWMKRLLRSSGYMLSATASARIA